ncbi:MAG: cupredoxin domain-containing protein [Candidatus Zixiibacteriota bacterium]|nr:MAG: cupredoxin domain-containing protein [candidate division Zixibacteria bacterium]
MTLKSTQKRILTGLFIMMASLFVAMGCGGNDENPASSSSDNTTNPPPPNPLPTTTVVIANFTFSPASVTVTVGTTVTWRNDDGIQHTVTSDSGSELESALLSQGGTYSHTFNTVGTFPYHCTPHPFMTGTVIVEQ